MTTEAIYKTPRMLREEERLGKPLEAAIKEAFDKFNGNMELMADELDIKVNTLYLYMIRLRLEKKTTLIQR